MGRGTTLSAPVKRALTPLLSALGALALVGLLIYGVTRTDGGDAIEQSIADGKPPAISTASLPALSGGRPISLRDLRGKVVVVNVFGSWCAPCRDEAPLLARSQAGLVRRGATLLGVTWKDTTDKARGFVREFHLGYPVVRDVDGSFARTLGVLGVPETFVVDRRGRIVAVSRLPLDQASLQRAVAKAGVS